MHLPVFKKEVIEYLDPKPNENFIDCTFGQGGHSIEILEKTGPSGKVLGIEIDSELYQKTQAELRQKRLILVRDSYRNLKEIVKNEKFGTVNGILFDLGLSSWHLEESKRGFSFKKNEIFDMRYDLNNPLTAKKILNFWDQKQIEEILKNYGEERFSKRIAKEIIKRRPIETTFQLVEIIKKATPHFYHRQRIHFATKTFQALRIAINDELENLKIALPQTLEILEREGRLVMISFHSLEDRIIKNFLSTLAKGYGGQERKLKILTKKPIRPSFEEIKINPRSRSAKLRAAIKL